MTARVRRRVRGRPRRGGWAALPARPAALRRNPFRVFHFVTALQVRLITAGLAGSAAHPPLRGRPPTRRRVRAVTSQCNIIARTLPQSGQTRNGTLARCDADGRCGGKQSDDQAVAPKALRRQSKRTCVRCPPGKERGKSASGSAQKRRTLKERNGKECDR